MEREIRITEEEENSKKNPLKFKKDQHKKRWSRKKTFLLIFSLIVLALGFFGFRIYDALSQIFAGSGINVPGLLGNVGRLKGEEDGRVNILFLGMGDKGHEGENLTDTIMVMSLNTKENKVAMVSIPRDMYVNIPGYGYARINEAHSQGEVKKKGNGPDKAKETVSQTLDIPIHYYARVDFTGFSKMVDAVGGVDINVEKDIYDPYYPLEKGEGVYSIDKGMHHMNGKEALKYVRSRKTTSDFDRAKRQQQVIVNVKEKMLASNTLFNPKKMLEIVDILGDHIKTDIRMDEIRRMYEISQKIDSGKIINKVVDNGESGLLVSDNVNGASVLRPSDGNLKKIREFVQNIFNERTSKEDEKASIMVTNSTGISGLAMKVSDLLKEDGYVTTGVKTGSSISNKTIIYDYTNGDKPDTADYLSKKFNATIKKDQYGTGDVDFNIVLGKDYVSN